MKKTIIHIDDASYWPETIKLLFLAPLKKEGFDFILLGASSAINAVEEIESVGAENLSLVIVDGKLLGSETAIEVYAVIRATGYQGKIILFSNDVKKISEIAEEKNYSSSDMFFAQINKDQAQELVKATIKALAE